MTSAKRFLVSGKVQGVYYRVSTVEKARALGLPGWVRNLDDGRVEVTVAGDDRRLQQLREWLWQGPEHARVDGVAVEDVELSDPPTEFQVR